ncbi:MAG: thiamine pyrophosphate-dependent enzyme, partial [Myxococcaceae bacterium]
MKEKAYRLMLLSRELDRKMLILLKQGKSFFHIGCMGHEAIQAAAALCLESKRDYVFPYYRDQALILGMGMSALDCLLGFLGKEGDPSSNARQMPQHYGHKNWNIPSSSSSTGTQYLQAVGCAFASMRLDKPKNLAVTVVCSGDGTTSQGDFHEALSWASREKAPVIFLVENNGYAISVPISDQRPGGEISAAYEGLHLEHVDGCDFEKSYDIFEKAVTRARAGKGPTLIDASVVRLLPHSSSDDDKKYRDKKDLERDQKRDPLIINKHLVSAKKLKVLEHEVFEEVDKMADLALAAPLPKSEDALKYVYASETSPPTPLHPVERGGGTETVLVDAINTALAEELERDPKMLVFGQDVAGGKGGVFTATRNLSAQFGDERCFNAPLAESSIIGVSIGLALRGFKPVPEIQFGDYIWTAMMQIRNELSVMRYRSNNTCTAPVVIRVPVGGYIHGGLCHSQNIEATFSHFPGLKIALPSNALDAYGLLKAAIRGDDPVLFLEHKSLYRQNFAKSVLPDNKDWVLPFGKGLIKKPGKDLSIITYGAM